MKLNLCRLPVIIVILFPLLIACNKKNNPNEKLRGLYTYKGVCRVSLDSMFIADSVTGATGRIVIDSTFDQTVSLFADTQYATFRMNSGLFNFGASFPVDGPYFYNGHYTTFYNLKFAGDSLYFDYSRHNLSGIFIRIKVEFAGKRL